jgi:hypothetical protein
MNITTNGRGNIGENAPGARGVRPRRLLAPAGQVFYRFAPPGEL